MANMNNGKSASVWSVHPKEYLDSGQASVLALHNDYSIGRQGGIEVIQHGERLATCGFLFVEGPKGHGFADRKERKAIDDGVEVVASLPGTDITYRTILKPEGDAVRMSVILDRPLSACEAKSARFDIALYPTALWGKAFVCGTSAGVFPRAFVSAVASNAGGRPAAPPLATGPSISIAPEDPLLGITFQSLKGDISLHDDRWYSESGWFHLRCDVPVDATGEVITWLMTPARIPGWKKPPMIGVSQVGYHPDQEKRAIIELDPTWDIGSEGPATLLRLDAAKGLVEVRSARPDNWGPWMRDTYAIFDFTDIHEEGVYFIRYGGAQAGPFRIARNVYTEGVWQPTLLDYFPVQMCHVKVVAGDRVWHDNCHMDDAMQVPWPLDYLDGYVQGPTSDTPFAPFQHIPHMDKGGWHDAGDTDLAAGSQAATTYWLCLAREEFGVDLDSTTVEPEKALVTMRRPDGIPDIVQQIIHGVENLLGGYRACGHSFCGIIESTAPTYYQRGDVACLTDNRVYDPSLPENAVEGNRSGRKDDRYAFTNRDTALEYMVAAALAASARVLRGFRDDLAEECLRTAEQVWDYEHTHEPAVSRSTYVPRDRQAMEIRLCAELLLATGSDKYRQALRTLWPQIIANPAQAAWPVMRVLDRAADADMKQALRAAMATWASSLHDELAQNPFRIHWQGSIWGIGWHLQDLACRYYYCLKAFPDLFQNHRVLDVVNWVLGCHPGGNNVSFVSGVGASSLTEAYGINRSDWSYIAGGVASGTAFIKPDMMELKTNFPWLWQQSEYVMSGAATWIFLVLAAEKLLNG